MLEQGCTREQIALAMMAKWPYRPRQAWRHAHGWTQQDVADRYNEVIDDPGAPMSNNRIADYEAWPRRDDTKPTPTVLHNLAIVFGTVEWKLVDFDDLNRMNRHERAALRPPSEHASVEQNLEVSSKVTKVESAHLGSATVGGALGQTEPLAVESRQPPSVETIPKSAKSSTDDRIVPRQLPPPVRHFTGREEELEYLTFSSTLVSNTHGNRPNAVIVCGPPGVGKTALVIEWANRLREKFRDGQLYFDLHGFDLVSPVSPDEVFDSFLRALGVSAPRLPASLDAQKSMYRSIVADQELLVVLDNVESAEIVRHFLVGPETTVLITSRNRLAGLEARDGAQCIALAPFSARESLHLLAKFLGRRQIEEAKALAGKLAHLCGHLPLALCIAAQNVVLEPNLSLSKHIDKLTEQEDLPGALSLDDDERTTLNTVFSWSYQKLTIESAHIFRCLGINPGRDISPEATAALCSVDVGIVRKVLRSFVTMYLAEEPSVGRYRLYDLLRAYAFNLAREEEGMETNNSAARELIRWYVASVGNANQLLTPGRVGRGDTPALGVEGERFTSFDEALAWLEHERANVIDIMGRAKEIGEYQAAAVLPDLMWSYFDFTKHWADWIRCNELGLESARSSGDILSEAYIRMNQGVLYTDLSRFPEAIENLEHAIRLFEQANHPLGLAYALQNLANVRSISGHGEETLANYARALEIFETLPDSRRGRGITLGSLAMTLNRLGRHAEAITAAEQARDLFEAIDDAEDTALIVRALGDAHKGLSQTAEALEFYQSALQLQRRINHKYGEGETLYAIGQLYADLGQTINARASLQEAVAIFTELDTPKAAEVTARLHNLPGNE